ncbi:hypothetical protein [Nocardia shimofusensis]|uniref:hypothetical protein n=1 Tax=Nocardia shimofusensis TaxID=228596 RepID=UPI000ADAFEE6|nr:hypothetical protein [Nocardia shimofusensis]
MQHILSADGSLFTVEGASFDNIWTPVAFGGFVAGTVIAVIFGYLAHKLSTEDRKTIDVYPFIAGGALLGVATVCLFATMRADIHWDDVGIHKAAYCGSVVNSAEVGYQNPKSSTDVMVGDALNSICHEAKDENKKNAMITGIVGAVLLAVTAYQYRRVVIRGNNESN